MPSDRVLTGQFVFIWPGALPGKTLPQARKPRKNDDCGLAWRPGPAACRQALASPELEVSSPSQAAIQIAVPRSYYDKTRPRRAQGAVSLRRSMAGGMPVRLGAQTGQDA